MLCTVTVSECHRLSLPVALIENVINSSRIWNHCTKLSLLFLSQDLIYDFWDHKCNLFHRSISWGQESGQQNFAKTSSENQNVIQQWKPRSNSVVLKEKSLSTRKATLVYNLQRCNFKFIMGVIKMYDRFVIIGSFQSMRVGWVWDCSWLYNTTHVTNNSVQQVSNNVQQVHLNIVGRFLKSSSNIVMLTSRIGYTPLLSERIRFFDASFVTPRHNGTDPVVGCRAGMKTDFRWVTHVLSLSRV